MGATTSNGRNKHKAAILEKEMITDSKSLADETSISAQATIVIPEAPATEVDHQPEVRKEVKPKGKKPIVLILAGLGVGAIAAGTFGYHYWQYASTHQETDNATVAGHIHQVSSKIPGNVSQVLVSDNQLVQPGQLLVKLDPQDYQSKVQQAEAALQNARRQAQAAEANIALTAQTTTGKTAQAQGDVSSAVAAISTAQAAVQEAQAGIPAAQAEVKLAQAGISAAQAQVAQANANLEKAQADYNRYNSLFKEGAIPRQQLDTARAAYDVAVAQKSAAVQGVEQAQARLASARVGVAKAQSQLAQAQENVTNAQAKLAASKGGLQQATAGGQDTTVKRSQYEAAKAAIAQSEASLKDAQLQLSYTNITAPSAGRVGRKNVEVGNRLQAGTPLMAIVDNEYWVIANFKETQLEKMQPGQEVEIKLDAFPHHTFIGHVDSISPASGAQFALLPPDNATGNFTKIVQRIPVKVVFDKKSIQGYESRITPGMSAEVAVEVK
ncbi:HlyD family efflux transporter periplasmic adaptor subunit [Komarekiella sp. 'clone 1']|uniref:HlyD family efflux transporter periplasmic adaptor subunit n=1 Tax=Komarekiella delphini-convector SJRDD-AB1 TaxID=2593771 RepID=A0AA40SV86_9NOST|nr:HlyD family secretion protein [Komarekiella delphini-convector]MBD6615878.1 HlyD family efflux transporter periplasmic adaptor subunit [Komarekiella delphini-convector SJRDD-AB1]